MRIQILRAIVLTALLAGCARQSESVITVLPAPGGTKPQVAAQLERGNALFASSDWTGAEQAYRQTIIADAGLAEAHYNLALTLDRMGKQAESRKHYMEAANLAPGNKVIWDSPPLRNQRDSLGHNIEKKSFQDPTYKGF
jgi:Flp pilus assembly protein TadD